MNGPFPGMDPYLEDPAFWSDFHHTFIGCWREAVLEMLSPANKVGDGFAEYRGKRQAILEKNTHLVELDLLLGGRRLPLSRPLPAGDYHALVSGADKRPDCDVYSWLLRQPLPRIPFPLRAPDADVLVDLRKVFQQTYGRGRYARSLLYGHAPHAPVITLATA